MFAFVVMSVCVVVRVCSVGVMPVLVCVIRKCADVAVVDSLRVARLSFFQRRLKVARYERKARYGSSTTLGAYIFLLLFGLEFVEVTNQERRRILWACKPSASRAGVGKASKKCPSSCIWFQSGRFFYGNFGLLPAW